MIPDLTSDPLVAACKAAAGEHWREPDNLSWSRGQVTWLTWSIDGGSNLSVSCAREHGPVVDYVRNYESQEDVTVETAPWYLLARAD